MANAMLWIIMSRGNIISPKYAQDFVMFSFTEVISLILIESV